MATSLVLGPEADLTQSVDVVSPSYGPMVRVVFQLLCEVAAYYAVGEPCYCKSKIENLRAVAGVVEEASSRGKVLYMVILVYYGL